MDYIQIIGLAAAFFTTLANIPQTYKIIKEKNTDGISSTTYTILLLGNALWLTYGILNTDWPLIIANSITVATCITILALNFSSAKTMGIIHEKILPEAVKKEAKKTKKRQKR